MRKLSVIIGALLVPQIALAHPGSSQGTFASGLFHPISGADHLLAMVTLGLLAAQIGGRALWALPLGFVSAMVGGGVAGWAGLPFPEVEPTILASGIILGALVALAAKPSFFVLIPGVMLFGFAHGWAHGAEGPARGLIVYAVGFVFTTTALHFLGIITGKLLQYPTVLRGLGAGAVLMGLALTVAK